MCFNNLDFYDKVHSTDYDYNRFARHRWNSMAIIKFLAFGVRIGLNDAEFWNKKRQAINNSNPLRQLPPLEGQVSLGYFALQTREIKRWQPLQAQFLPR